MQFLNTCQHYSGNWCLWDGTCHKDHFNWDYELEHWDDAPYVQFQGMLRQPSFLGNCHGDIWWEPQHVQKLGVGQMTAALGHVVAAKQPLLSAAYQDALRLACPGVSQTAHGADSACVPVVTAPDFALRVRVDYDRLAEAKGVDY